MMPENCTRKILQSIFYENTKKMQIKRQLSADRSFENLEGSTYEKLKAFVKI